MNEVYKMFNYAGVKIPEYEIETLFHRAALITKQKGGRLGRQSRFNSVNNHIRQLNLDLEGDDPLKKK
jgi:hypothetical protein